MFSMRSSPSVSPGEVALSAASSSSLSLLLLLLATSSSSLSFSRSERFLESTSDASSGGGTANSSSWGRPAC